MKSLSVLIKPASSLCNMRCKYCFYADVSSNREVKSYGVMSGETMEALIRRCFELVNGRGEVNFAFQGGEPTVAGIGFFQNFIACVRRLCPPEAKVSYSIQTNGLAVDEEWCRLFGENKFLVGLSFDGTSQLHDFLRPDAAGNPTARRVLGTAERLEKAGVDFNILTVITGQLARHPRQVFDFYLKHHFRYVQLIPCLNPLDGETQMTGALPPRLYASFLKDFFRFWVDALGRGEYVSVRLFDNLVRMAGGGRPEQCGLLGFCQPQFVVEADGGVYPCDFYVLDSYLCGNVRENSFQEMADSASMRHFLEEPAGRNDMCRSCRAYSLCGGGCKRYRSFYFSEKGYCPYQDFLVQAYPELRRIAQALNGSGGLRA